LNSKPPPCPLQKRGRKKKEEEGRMEKKCRDAMFRVLDAVNNVPQERN